MLTLTSSGGSATIGQWQAALQAVTYTDTAITPNNATRTINFSVIDANSSSSNIATRDVSVADTDQTPILTTSPGTTNYVVGASAQIVDPGVTVSDLDNTTQASGTAAVTVNFQSGVDVLAFTNDGSTMGNIAASYDSATGVLTLTSAGATATNAQWANAFSAVTFSAPAPATAGTRTIAFVVNDGTENSAAATHAVDVIPSYTITGTANPSVGGSVTCTPNPVNSGGSSTCTVSANRGYSFSAFSGDCAGATCALTNIQTNKNVTATFTPVTTFNGPTSTGSGDATASFTGGGPACAFARRQFVSVVSASQTPPSGYVFPHGLFSFTAVNCTVGGSLSVTITYPQPIPSGAVLYKFGPTAANTTPHWYVFPAMILGDNVTYTVTDGGSGDDDLAANGSVVDPSGIAVVAPPVSLPLLSTWMLMLLGGLVGAVTLITKGRSRT